MGGPWTKPQDHPDEPYPGIHVWDARVSGSITHADTRLPLWAYMYEATRIGADAMRLEHNLDDVMIETAANFIADLMQVRGCWARLVCELAEAERQDRVADEESDRWWIHDEDARLRVLAALDECRATIAEDGA